MPGTEIVTIGPAQDLRPAAAGGKVERLAAAAAAYADAAQAASTRRAYESSMRAFTTWCAANHFDPRLPVAAELLAQWLADLAPSTSPATLSRHLAAVRWVHRHNGFAAPTDSFVSNTMSGIRQKHGRPPRKKRALVTDDIKAIVRLLPVTKAGIRDKALILMCFASALRRGELVGIDIGADTSTGRCVFHTRGVQILLSRSKTDQEGRGQMVAVPFGKTKFCPVKALQAWLEHSGITSGPIFRTIDRHGRMGGRMSAAAAAEILKRAAEAAGYDPAVLGCHSLRAGLVTSAAQKDVSMHLIMRQARHVKSETTNGYIREEDLFKRNAAGLVGL
jgi:integrase